jgi:hypothetical protein
MEAGFKDSDVDYWASNRQLNWGISRICGKSRAKQ